MGFGAYSASPFANLLPSTKFPHSPPQSPPPQSTNSFASSGFASFSTPKSSYLISSSRPKSPASPRGSTPKPGSAFGSYSNSVTGFGKSGGGSPGQSSADHAKRVISKDPSSSASFGDILADKGSESESQDSKIANIEEVDGMFHNVSPIL